MCSERVPGRTLRHALPWSVAACLLTLGSAPALADPAAVEPVHLDVRPDTCVALHRGQTCFRRITLSWPSLPDGRYCLVREPDDGALVCFRAGERRQWLHDYADPSAERYRLERVPADGGVQRVVAVAEVSTAWVYRDSRRGASGWRLF